jgi:hypothetical protein
MLILGWELEITWMEMPKEELVLGEAQANSGSAVTVQLTLSPFCKLFIARVSLLVPTFSPFTFH